MSQILAGDIGGTNSRLALFEATPEGLELSRQERFASADHDGLEQIVALFLGGGQARCEAACFGIAGPVRDGAVRATNLPWVVEAARVAEATGIPNVDLLNDLVANAWGIEALVDDDFLVLAEGEPELRGNRALIAAGTGLGEAGLVWNGDGYRPFASEGGHVDFAAGSDLEIDLLRYLRRRFGHVSWERVLAGPGLVNVFLFLYHHRQQAPPGWLVECEAQEDGAAACITRAAQTAPGDCEPCREALDLFVRFYGVEAGNLALKLGATGGVFLGGGIAPKIGEELRSPSFMEAFCAKGRMREVLEKVPVKVILNDQTALLGAARCALRRLEER